MTDSKLTMSRRQALGLIASTAAAAPIMAGAVPALPQQKAVPKPLPTLRDPNLLNPEFPWALLLDAVELATLSALCDVIIPADAESPAASALGAQNYINEHVSAPYDKNRADLIEVRGGIVWLNSESETRFGKPFASLSSSQQINICDDIHWAYTAKPEFRYAARFFGKVRNMTASAYFTTRKGMAYVGYVGNVPMQHFPPPPKEVLKKLGLD